jgi:hypothetical protein
MKLLSDTALAWKIKTTRSMLVQSAAAGELIAFGGGQTEIPAGMPAITGGKVA